MLQLTTLAVALPWTRLGPWNIYDDKNNMGEAGTIACAAASAARPDRIFAGGQNNGVSSGILRTDNGGSKTPH